MNSVPLFDLFFPYLQMAIQLIGVMVIAAGAFTSFCRLMIGAWVGRIDANYIRLQLGNSVILGLEFMVGADIIGSLVRPDYYTVGILAIVVLIRTILSYFLNLELERLTPEQKKNLS